MGIKSKIMVLMSIAVLLMLVALTSANATVETGWPDGTPNNCRNASDSFIDFELGAEEAEIESTIPGIEFTTTYGLNWRYGDIRTGNYNVNPYGGAMYETNGNFFGWLGVTGDAGRITFTGGSASYVSALFSTYSGVTLDAYDADGNFLATSGWATNNINTGTLTRLTVEAEGIAYVEIHDTGNYWLMDDLCTDAAPPCQPVPGRTIGDHDDRIDLIFVPDDDYNGDINTFLQDVANNINNRLDAVAPIDANLDRFNFYYTRLEGNVSSSNCGQESSLPNNLLSMCPYANAVVVLHTNEFGDCNRNSGGVGIFSAEGAVGRSLIHEGGHGIFGLRDEYDSNRSTTPSCTYTAYNTNRPLPSNIWEIEADCRNDAQGQGWDPDQCYQFTPCQSDWWKLGDPSLATDDDRYNDANYRFIMFDGYYFANGFGAAAERRINWVFDQLPVTPEPGLPSPSKEKSIILELNISDSGLVLLKSSFVTAPPPEYLPGEYSLMARMFSTSGNLLGEYGFIDPRIVQAELGYTGPFTLGSANFTLLLPYFNSIGEAKIVDTETGVPLLSVDLSAFATGGSAPIADAGGLYSGKTEEPITFDASGSYDPDGTIVLYEWDWENDGTYDETTTSPIITHIWTTAFTGTVRLRVTDNDGLIGIDTASVEIIGVIPGDLDGDGDVDQNDLNKLLTYRNKPASACPACDIDGDGKITVLDSRKLVLMCTRPRCATK